MQDVRKHSAKRDAIVERLRTTVSHPTADWLFEQLRADGQDVSRATVYRILAQMRAQGRVVSVATVGGFERYDYNIAPHPHFICSNCSAVLDVDGLPLDQRLCCQAAARLDAQVDGAWLTFTGVCAGCLRKAAPEQSSENQKI